MLTHDLTELVITLTGYKVDLEFMSAAREGMIVSRVRDKMYAIYTGVYCHGVLHLGCLGKVLQLRMLIRLIVLVKGFAKYI